MYASLFGVSGAFHLDVFEQPEQQLFFSNLVVKNPVLPHGASSKEKAILAIHPRSSGRGILAFSRQRSRKRDSAATAYSAATASSVATAYSDAGRRSFLAFKQKRR